jgi:hypothetical protein
MTIREDALRALEYGKSEYHQAITSFPSYQAELARVRTDYNERTWIDFTGFLPKFTTAEFEKRRTEYQAKYGNTVNIPGFSDVVHIIPKAQISAEERAAHLWATKRGLPSPLTPAQIESLTYKKFRFIKALASATPSWMKTYGAVATVLDNVEDALVTVTVFGRIAVKLAPRLLGRLVPGLGWILMGADILNAVNLISWGSAMTRGCKQLHGGWQEKNPFHAKAAAARTLKLNRTIPSFGEFLEIMQTTDQLFGVGLCLGGLMGIVTDTATRVMTYDAQEVYKTMPKTGNIEELTRWANQNLGSDVDKFKKGLTEQWVNFRDEAYRLKAIDIKLREDIFNWTQAKSKETWDWIKTTPETASKWFSSTVIGSMIMSTGKDDFLKEDHTKAFMMLNSAITGLMPWWIENDPLTNFKDLRSFKFRAPSPTDSTTIDMLDEYSPQWKSTLKWPHLDQEYATIEEICFAYAPMIKDSFQTYCLKYQHEWEAYVAASQTVDFVKNVIRSFDDNNEVKVGYTAWVATAIDMMDQRYIMEPDTPAASIDALADYIGNHERATGIPPKIKDVARFGESIGIEWMRSFPTRAFEAAAEIFPEWGAIQDQLDELYVAD